MNIFLAFFFSFFIYQPGLENRIADQASYYLDNIISGADVSENYWALNELYQSSCANNKSVIRIIISSNFTEAKSLFTSIPCGNSELDQAVNKLKRIREIALKIGSSNLSAHYLLFEQDLNKKEEYFDLFKEKWNKNLGFDQITLLESIINEKEFSSKILLSINSEFLFNSILFSNKFIQFIPSDYRQEIATTWINEFESTYANRDLLSSIQLTNIISVLYELDRYPQVRLFLDEVYNDKYYPISTERARLLNAASYSLFVIGRYDESLNILRGSLIPLYEYLKLTDRIELSEFTKGVNLYSLGKFEEAKDTFENIYYDSDSSIPKFQLFNNLSICYFKLGEKNKYLDLQLNALDEATKSTNYKEKLIILRNLFIYYTSIKDSKTALLYLNRAEKIASDNNDNYELAAIHAFSGTFYWENYKDADKALKELRIAQQEFDPNKDFADFVNVLKEEAEILVAISSLEHARKKFEELKQLSIQSSNTPNYLESLIGLTEIELLESNLDAASKLIEEIKIYPLDDIDFELLVKYNTVKSLLTFSNGHKRYAYKELMPVVSQVIERAKTSIDSQTGFWSIEPEYIDAFNTIINMLIELDNESRALQLLDELKTINDVALYNSPILRAKRLSEEDLAQDQLLNTQILKLRTEYLNSSNTEKFEIKKEIDQLSAQREQILNKIRTNINDNPISTWSLQKKLETNEMILHFTEVGEELYASYITRESIKIDVIEFNADTKRLFEEAANSLASSNTNLEQLYSIYNALGFKHNIPSEINSLTVVPDNYLFRLPLDILPVEQPESIISYGSAKYLIEYFDVRYYTSLNSFITNSREITSDYDLDFSAFALSDFSNFEDKNLQSLPFATKEVRSINTKLENFKNKSIFLESDADKSTFLERAQSSKIVHVATHSEVSEQDPLFSTIYLNNSDNKELTSLYAYELFDMQMNSELIMLNSCSSGSGSYLQGSGIMGISRALRYAGAKSLALNLWSVNDKAASEFATSFYSTINEGSSKWRAMRSAKLSLLKTGNANPYYWGAYILIGNSSPLTKKPAKAGFLYPILLVIITWFSYKIRQKNL